MVESRQDALSQPFQPGNAQPVIAGRERVKRCREGWLNEDHAITKFRWENCIRLKDKNYRAAKLYLKDRDGPYCFFCDDEELNLQRFNIDHIDGKSWKNKRWNLRLAHHDCNNMAYQQEKRVHPHPADSTLGRVSVSGNVLVAGAGSELGVHWASREGADSERMNAAIDTWLNDLENGPFVVRTSGGVALVPVELKTLAFMGAALLRSDPKIGHGSPICYSDDTYVLTEDGWKLHSSWNKERIVVYDPLSDKMFLETPSIFVRMPYEGKMVHISSHRFDILVTPNHRMFVCTSKTKVTGRGYIGTRKLGSYLIRSGSKSPKYWRIVEAQELFGYKEWISKVNGSWVSQEVPGPFCFVRNLHTNHQLTSVSVSVPEHAFLKLAGYYLSEGSNSAHKTIRITQSARSPHIVDLDSLMSQLPFTSGHSDSLVTRFNTSCIKRDYHIYNSQLYRWFVENCGTNSHTKRIPSSLKNLGTEYLRDLFEAMMNGDGSWTNGKKNSGYYLSASRQLALDFLEVATKLGYASYLEAKWIYNKLMKRQGLYFKVYITRNNERTFSLRESPRTSKKRGTISMVDYKGFIYCFKTTTGFYVTMRNGRPTIQGNTVERYLWLRSLGSTRNEPAELEIRKDSATGMRMVTYKGKKRFLPNTEKKEDSRV